MTRLFTMTTRCLTILERNDMLTMKTSLTELLRAHALHTIYMKQRFVVSGFLCERGKQRQVMDAYESILKEFPLWFLNYTRVGNTITQSLIGNHLQTYFTTHHSGLKGLTMNSLYVIGAPRDVENAISSTLSSNGSVVYVDLIED